MTYIGQQPATTFDAGIQDRFTGLSTNTVTLNHEIAAEEDILVVWNNIVQDKNTYSCGGTGNKTITLGGTLSSSDVVTVYYLNKVMQSVNPTAGSVTSTILGSDILSGQTDIGADIADADLFLVDDGAGGTVRKSAASRLKTYIGDNTPAFQAHRTGTQSISNSTFTKIQNNVELFDSDSAYDHSTNYRFTIPSGASGKYLFGVSVNIHDLTDTSYAYALVYKNGSKLKENIVSASRTIPTSVHTITIDDASDGDYYEAYTKQVSGGSLDLNHIYGNVFFGYRIMGA